MEIKNPRRILFLGYRDSGVLGLLKDLTGSAPEARPVDSASDENASRTLDQSLNHEGGLDRTTISPATDAQQRSVKPLTSTAGLTSSLRLSNKYYAATLPIWIDEILDSPQFPSAEAINPTASQSSSSGLQSWTEEFLSPSASEVIRAVGAYVVVFRASSILNEHQLSAVLELMNSVKQIIANVYDDNGGFGEHGDLGDWDGALLAVATSGGGVGNDSNLTGFEDKWADFEDRALEYGFEVLDARGSSSGRHDKKRNEAAVKRIVQALEVVDWNCDDELDALNEDLQQDEEFSFADVGDEDFASMKKALLDPNDKGDDQVDWGESIPDGEEGLSRQFKTMGIDHQTLEDTEGALQVEQLEQIMLRMQAAKDMSAHMSDAERKRFAARTVNELMKDL